MTVVKINYRMFSLTNCSPGVASHAVNAQNTYRPRSGRTPPKEWPGTQLLCAFRLYDFLIKIPLLDKICGMVTIGPSITILLSI
jgi:hypothetical protein